MKMFNEVLFVRSEVLYHLTCRSSLRHTSHYLLCCIRCWVVGSGDGAG